jgi:ADP-heptose:LPS heptosyltransferase
MQTRTRPVSFARAMPLDPVRSAEPRPLPYPGQGIAVISERESLGDGFYKLHLLRALKRAYPAEAIDWYVSEGPTPYAGPMAKIVAGYVAKVVPFAGFRRPRWQAIGRLRALPAYSLAIDNRTNNAVVMGTRLLLRAHLYQAPTPGYIFCSRRPGGIRPRHKLARLMKLLEAVTACPVDGDGEIPLAPDFVERAQRLLPEGPRYVGLVPGASGPERCWPVERYIELARWIRAQGARPVFILGPVEQALLERLRQALPDALFPGSAEGETLREVELSLAVGRRLAAAVSNDTGTGHLLAAAGAPLLSVFGPTDPRIWRPVARRFEIVWAREHGGREMERIPLAAVTAALERLMGQPG